MKFLIHRIYERFSFHKPASRRWPGSEDRLAFSPLGKEEEYFKYLIRGTNDRHAHFRVENGGSQGQFIERRENLKKEIEKKLKPDYVNVFF